MTEKGFFHRFPTLGLAAAIVLSSVPAPARDKPPALDPAEQKKLDAILVKFDQTQGQTRTLTATFTERKEIALLKEPVVAKGRFYYTKPDDVLWQYTEPDPRYILISKDELLSYFPAKRSAERMSIRLFHDRLMKVWAIGQPSGRALRICLATSGGAVINSSKS